MALKAYKLFMETRLGSGEVVYSVASCSKCNQMVAREININKPPFSLCFVQRYICVFLLKLILVSTL